jgi:hypothetical protein
MPSAAHPMSIPACRHAAGTISSSAVADVWRMASEDSDQVLPGLLVVHRLRDLGDLNETVDCQMTSRSHDLEAFHESLEVFPLRRSKRMLLEEGHDDLSEVGPSNHGVPMQMLPVVVAPSIHGHASHAEELLQLHETRHATRALHYDEAVNDLVPGSVALSAHPAWLPDEANREASFSIYKTNYPATILDQSFLLVFRTAQIVTAHRTSLRRVLDGYIGFSSI